MNRGFQSEFLSYVKRSSSIPSEPSRRRPVRPKPLCFYTPDSPETHAGPQEPLVGELRVAGTESAGQGDARTTQGTTERVQSEGTRGLRRSRSTSNTATCTSAADPCPLTGVSSRTEEQEVLCIVDPSDTEIVFRDHASAGVTKNLYATGEKFLVAPASSHPIEEPRTFSTVIEGVKPSEHHNLRLRIQRSSPANGKKTPESVPDKPIPVPGAVYEPVAGPSRDLTDAEVSRITTRQSNKRDLGSKGTVEEASDVSGHKQTAAETEKSIDLSGIVASSGNKGNSNTQSQSVIVNSGKVETSTSEVSSTGRPKRLKAAASVARTLQYMHKQGTLTKRAGKSSPSKPKQSQGAAIVSGSGAKKVKPSAAASEKRVQTRTRMKIQEREDRKDDKRGEKKTKTMLIGKRSGKSALKKLISLKPRAGVKIGSGKRSGSSVAQRPKRVVIPKSQDDSSGLSWKEETQLKKALYASLQESKKLSRQVSGESPLGKGLAEGGLFRNPQVFMHGGRGQLMVPRPYDENSQDSTKSSVNADDQGIDKQRARVHAQRKFAQGSRPCSPTMTTPVKFKPTPKKVFTQKRAKTEDFLTFLCLRGSPSLPPHLNFFNYSEAATSQSCPNTPSTSINGSRPATPGCNDGNINGTINGRSMRPATPSPSKSVTGDKEISLENPDLGVKPLPKEEPPSAPTQSNSEVKKSSKTAKTPPKVVKKSPVASSPVKSEPPSPAKTRSSQLLPVVPLKRIHQEHVTRTCRSASAGGHAVRAMASNQPRRLVLGKDKQKNAKGRKREKTQAVEMTATPSPKKRKEMEGVILSTKQKVSSHVKTEASRKLVQKAKGSKPKSPVKTKTVSKVQKVGCKVKKDAIKRKPAPFVPKKSKRLIAQASKSGVYVELSQSDIDMIAVVSDKDDQLEKSLPKPKPAVPKPRDKSPEKSKPDNSVSKKSVAEEACTTPKVPKKCSSTPSSGPKQKAPVKKTAKLPSDTNNPRDMRPKLLKMKTRASPQIIKQATKTTASTSKQPTIQLAPTIPFPSPDGVARMEGIPVYHPSPEQFQDPISYITSVRNDAEHYGMCRIVPPDGWQPECKIPDDLRFTTQIQYINKLKTRWGPNSIKMECIRRHLEGLGIRLEQPPLFGGVELDLPGLYDTIQKFGGMQKVIDKKKWLKVADTLGVPKQAQDRRTKLYEAYCKYLLSYDTLSKEEKDKLEQQVLADRAKKNKPQPDCMAKGKSRTLSEYYRIARNTMSMRFKDDPSSDQVETEFWGIVGDSKSHVAVQAGHLDTKHCGSGFPTKKESPYSRHGWNFHMLQNNSGSLLKHIGLVSGVTVPAVHIGMLFSVSAWSQDPHLLPYIQYMHTGSDKVWYCVPRNQEEILKTALQELVPGLMSNSACWLKPDTVMVSPQDLLSKGVSIGRTVLSQGQFVVVFPACTTATISCGYNLCESLRFATTDWLPLGCKAARMLQSSGEMELFSTERLLFKLARHEKTSTEVLRKLLPELEQIVEKELSERKQLSDLGLKASEKMNVDDQVSPTGKRKRIHDPSEDEDNRCEVCNKMCYLSMVRNDGEDCVYSLGHAIPHIQKKRNLKLCRLIYRHEEKELKEIVNRVKERLESHTTPNKKRVLKGKAKADS